MMTEAPQTGTAEPADPGALQLPEALPDVESLALDRALQVLCERGADLFDPGGFAYLDALIQRAQRAEGELAAWYDVRARRALGDYTDRAETARCDAVSSAQALYCESPALAPAINAALASWDNRALRRLEQGQRTAPDPGPLLALVSEIEALHRESPLEDAGAGLEQHLRQQEQLILAEFGSAGGRLELRSARSYRQRMQRTGADQLLAHSVADAPQESGPLNPQKLATRALSTMQQLSPSCSARFVSWLNTLLYLENLDQS